MTAAARAYTGARAMLKLTGDPYDADRVRAVRDALPSVWIGVDVNQGFDHLRLEKLFPTLVQARVALIEQPFSVGHEGLLDDLDSPIPIAADESVPSLGDITPLVGRMKVTISSSTSARTDSRTRDGGHGT